MLADGLQAEGQVRDAAAEAGMPGLDLRAPYMLGAHDGLTRRPPAPRRRHSLTRSSAAPSSR